MHHPVAIVTQIAQESGQHGGRLHLRVVQQDDALARRLEAVGQQFQLRFLRHRDPVVGNHIGAEHDDAAFLEGVSPNIDIVVAGHTHIARAQPRIAPTRDVDGVAWYFNSGTWIALVDIRPRLLETDHDFSPVWAMLTNKNKTLSELIAAPDAVIRNAAAAVRIETRGAKVCGELLRFSKRGDEPDVEKIGACEFDARVGG